MTMKDRNAQLKTALGAMASKERVHEVASIPQENTKNIEGHSAYALDNKIRLVSMLNTLKLKPQFYRTESQTMRELRDLIEQIAVIENDAYFVAQAIVWSRCKGEGMRSINHLAAALVAPYVSGTEYAKRFYGAWDKKNEKGGTIYRTDDMTEIKDAYDALNSSTLANAMKKGFASVLENMDTYQLAKYKDTVIDIANLCHPNSEKSNAYITLTTGERVKTLDAIMQGLPVAADTWEHAQTEAGQVVAQAVREGKLSKAEAETVLSEAKADNWESLLKDGKLGIMAALRNIRNIMKNPRKETIDAWCNLVTNAEKVRKALILPIHFDLAYDVVRKEFGGYDYEAKVEAALLDGYNASIPNLKDALAGRTCVVIDCSGSMSAPYLKENASYEDYCKNGYSWGRSRSITDACQYKAGLVAATIAKATNADIIKFGSSANYAVCNKNKNVFTLAKELGTSEYGGTNLSSAFELMRRENRAYDRVIIISDNAINAGNTVSAYKQYIHDVCSPYIYCIDLAAYGTVPVSNDGKTSFYYGYGASMYEDISKNEFNPASKLDEITKIVI